MEFYPLLPFNEDPVIHSRTYNIKIFRNSQISRPLSYSGVKVIRFLLSMTNSAYVTQISYYTFVFLQFQLSELWEVCLRFDLNI